LCSQLLAVQPQGLAPLNRLFRVVVARVQLRACHLRFGWQRLQAVRANPRGVNVGSSAVSADPYRILRGRDPDEEVPGIENQVVMLAVHAYRAPDRSEQVHLVERVLRGRGLDEISELRACGVPVWPTIEW